MSVIIINIARGGLADKAGLREGDEILTVNGVVPGDSHDVVRMIQASDKAHPLAIAVIRPGKIECENIITWSPGDDKIGATFKEYTGTDRRLADLEYQAKSILSEIEMIRSGGTVVAPQPARQPAPRLAARVPFAPAKGSEDTETQIGKYILSKAGVISIVAGVAFLIAYTFRYLMPFHKIMIGYLISAAMLTCGIRLEKREKFIWYGRGLVAGGWALAYFTTFAMHHIAATMIISSQLLDLVILSAVVAAMVVHLLKYRSESVISMTLALGYITAGISTVSYFTFIYIALLAITAVILAYRMEWQRVAIFSLVGTYVTHMIWIAPKLYEHGAIGRSGLFEFWLSMGFLGTYWLIYNAFPLLMLIKERESARLSRGFVLINGLLFGLLGLFEVSSRNLAWRFDFALLAALAVALFGAAARYSKNREHIGPAYFAVAIVFLTSALPFRYGQTGVNFIWIAEVPFILYLGLRSPGRLMYRSLAYILSAVLVIRCLWYLGASKTLLVFAGRELSARLFVFAAAALLFFALRFIFFRFRDDQKLFLYERKGIHLYTVAATLLLIALSGLEIRANLVTLTWALTAFMLFVAGFLVEDRVFRFTAMGTLGIAGLRIICVDLAGVNTIYRILLFICLGSILLLASYWYTKTSGVAVREEKRP